MSATQFDRAAAPESTRPPLRVLVTVHRYFPEQGGIETHIAEVLKRLSKDSAFSFTLLTTDLTGKLPAEEVVDGVTVLRVPAWPRNRDYYLAPRIPGIIGQPDRWDLVHCQGIHNAVPVLSMRPAARGSPTSLPSTRAGIPTGCATRSAPPSGGSSDRCCAAPPGLSVSAGSKRKRSRATHDSPRSR